jgi:hypothetical protein
VAEATPWLNWGGRQPPIEWPATLVFLFYFHIFIFIFLKKLINILLAGLGWLNPWLNWGDRQPIVEWLATPIFFFNIFLKIN